MGELIKGFEFMFRYSNIRVNQVEIPLAGLGI